MVQSLVGLFVYLCLCRHFKYSNASDNSEVKSVLNAEEIKVMLLQHNDFRRSVTPSASNMRALSWDEKLANLAQAYANKCVFKHSVKTAMDPYGYIAESIYIGNERSQTFSNEEVARPVVSWCNESKFYDYNLNRCRDQEICGHYTQAVWDKTYHLGCGRTRCQGNVPVGNGAYLNPIIVVCKYGPAGNTRRIFQKSPRRPYKHGEWCSRCPNEAPVCVNKLCDIERNSSVKTAPVSPVTTTKSLEEAATTSIFSSTSVSTTTTSTISSTSVSTATTSTSKTAKLIPPVEFPLTPSRKLITVNLVTVNRLEVENAGPIERSGLDLRRSEPVGLMCYMCNGGTSVSQCLSKNKTMLCDDEDLTFAMSGSNQNDWSCAKYNKDNKIEMRCIQTAKCNQIKQDEDSSAECCRTDFCNDAKATRSSIRMLSLTNVFILLIFWY